MRLRCLFVLILLPGLHAQPCLSLSTAAAAPDGSAMLELALNSWPGRSPASLQWRLQLPPSGIKSLSVDSGPATAVAGKTLICINGGTVFTCLVAGSNANPIQNGVIARVNAALALDSISAAISIRNVMGASPAGESMDILSSGGVITRGRVSIDRKLRPPLTRIAGKCATQ